MIGLDRMGVYTGVSLDAAANGVSRAMPLLMASVVLMAIPQCTRYMVNLKRALHAYDDQVPAQSDWKFKQVKAHIVIRFLAAFLALAPLTMELFLFLTPAINAQSHPIIHQIRLAVPRLFLGLTIWLTMFSALYRSDVAQGNLRRSVGRTLHQDQRQAGQACTSDLLTRKPEWHARRFLLWASLSLFYALFYTHITYDESTDARLSMGFVGLSASLVAFNGLRGPLTFRRHSSFRGMIIVTWGYLTVCFLPALVGALVDAYSDKHVKAPAPKKPEAQQHGWLKTITDALVAWANAFESDLPVAQFVSIGAPFIWAFCLIIPAHMILLGARFDLGHLTVPDADECDAALTQSTSVRKERIEAQVALMAERNGVQAATTTERTALLDEKLPMMPESKITAEDKLGRIPILMQSIALPNSTLSLRDLPTFRAGFIALIVCWLSSLIAVFAVDELPPTTFPLTSSKGSNPLESFGASTGLVMLLCILSLFVVPLAMLFAAWDQGQARGGAKGLWKYNEKWEKPGYVRADLAKAEAEEAAVAREVGADLEA